MIGIAFLLVISIASAGVLSYYGKIVGSVNVQPPVFYASKDCSDSVCKIYINNLPSEHSGYVSKNPIYFDSESLGVNEWYAANWKIILKLKGTADDQRVDYVLRFANNEYKSICSGYVTISTSIKEKTITCSPGEIQLSPQHYLELWLSSKYDFDTYTDGSTRVEVNPA